MKLKHWLIRKLGGYVLDEEEKVILRTFTLQRASEKAKRKIDKDLSYFLLNGFYTTRYEK